jgi:hypothetical protein
MKQIWPNYSYSPTTNVLTLTGLNIDRDQLLLVTAANRGRIMYNFADSSVTASAFTSGANTALTLVATTAGLTTTAALVIYYDDQVAGISGTVTANVVAYDESNDGLSELRSYSVGSRGGALQVVGPSYTGAVTASGLPCVPIFGSVTIGSSLPAGANKIGVVTIGAGTVTLGAGTAQIGSVTVGNSVTIGSLPAISGTVTANVNGVPNDNGIPYFGVGYFSSPGSSLIQVSQDPNCGLPINGTVTIGSALPAGTNRIGVVTIGAGTVTLGASTAQIGSVTASISGTVPISISSVTVGNSVTIGSCVTHGVTITNTVVTFFPAQGTTVTNSNFTSTTASTTLVSALDGREVLTVFNEGPTLYISPGATCTTVAYQVRLSAGDYWECPAGQLTLAHTAVFATAGTARVTQVS